MRKKAHRRINANNREYDRFYVINYLVRDLAGAPQTDRIQLDGSGSSPESVCVCGWPCVCVMSQELGKTWEEVQSEDDRELVEQDDGNDK